MFSFSKLDWLKFYCIFEKVKSGEKLKLDKSDLCYSLNVFPSDHDIAARLKHIGNKFNKIRQSLGLNEKTLFALGFWADAIFVEQMKETKNLQKVQQFLEQNNFYVFTVNAFPYGQFHSAKVKEKVYIPDWTTAKRRDFTCDAADFLANLIPADTPGSISTLPGGYKKALYGSQNQDFEKIIAKNLLYVANHLANLHKKTKSEIILGVEMEPDCLWEDTAEFVEFFNKYLADDSFARRYIGVCYDTAHQELLDTPPGNGLYLLQKNRIKIAKVQLSTALKTDNAELSGFDSLQSFADEVYLHQTRLFNTNGEIIKKFSDIPIKTSYKIEEKGYLVSHFHLPLFCSDLTDNISTANEELQAVLEFLKKSPEICKNIEIETYTYNVLPEAFENRQIEDNIAREYKWVLDLWDLI